TWVHNGYFLSNSPGIGAGLLQSPRGSAPSQMECGFMRFFITAGLDWRNSAGADVAGWKSEFLMIVGVRKMIKLSFIMLLLSLRKAHPSPGMSPRSGTLL